MPETAALRPELAFAATVAVPTAEILEGELARAMRRAKRNCAGVRGLTADERRVLGFLERRLQAGGKLRDDAA